MAINPRKLEAFANHKKKNNGNLPGGKRGRFPIIGKRHEDDEEENDHDEEHGKRGRFPAMIGKRGDDEGGDEHEDKHVDVAKIANRVSSGHGDQDIMDKVEGYDPEQDGNPPQWVANEDIWEKAKAAVKPEESDYDEPWAVVAHVYKQMGGQFN